MSAWLRRRTWVVLALGAFAAGSASVALSQGFLPDANTSAYGDLGPVIPGPADPLLVGGHLATLDEASRILGRAVPRPVHPSASDDSLTEVWVQPETGEVALRYASGIRAYVTSWPARPAQTPAEFYEQQAREAGAGRATTIGGYPALVIPKDAQAPGWPPVAVMDITIGSLEVSLHADLPVEQLIRVAQTVR